MGIINETIASVLMGKHPRENISSCYMLDTFKETPILSLWTSQKMQSNILIRNYQGALAL